MAADKSDCYTGGMEMGEIKVKAKLENSGDLFLFNRGELSKKKIRTLEIDAVVDTGAVMILLPQDLVERLGLRVVDKTIVTLANDRKVAMDIAGDLTLTVAGRRWSTDCLVGPPGCQALLGQLVLERLDLILDPLKQTITPRPESPYLPTLNMKQACLPVAT